MKRVIIDKINELQVKALDEDCFQISNREVDIIMSYDSLYELALQIAHALNEETPSMFNNHHSKYRIQ